MKKFLAVLLAALMIFSVMAVGVVAVAETGTTSGGDSGSNVELPDWLVELIARIKQVIAKILFKLGIKINWK